LAQEPRHSVAALFHHAHQGSCQAPSLMRSESVCQHVAVALLALWQGFQEVRWSRTFRRAKLEEGVNLRVCGVERISGLPEIRSVVRFAVAIGAHFHAARRALLSARPNCLHGSRAMSPLARIVAGKWGKEWKTTRVGGFDDFRSQTSSEQMKWPRSGTV
jgi:hypothetical protein